MRRMLYVCSFPLVGHSGHKRATRQKLEALAEFSDLRVVSSWFENRALRMLELPFLEIRAALAVLTQKPDVIVSRGSVGLIFQRVARAAGVFTVREVHANALEEVSMLGKSVLVRLGLRTSAWISDCVDHSCEMRIFNNPILMRWFHANCGGAEHDVAVYNGYCLGSGLAIERAVAREHLGLAREGTYLAFTGSASEWHGVEYLVGLQKEFDEAGDGIKIVCGGGRVASHLDPDGRLLNLTPLDDIGCSKLIRACNLSLLPVKHTRVSPGSPLKLYDYIVNKSWIVAQEHLEGYADEVVRPGVGATVDFRDSRGTRLCVLELLRKIKQDPSYPEVDASWRSRMLSWLEAIEGALGRRTASP